MTTHRSLNKLEKRAHLSLHAMVDVTGDELPDSGGFTRDRFGKRHPLPALEHEIGK